MFKFIDDYFISTKLKQFKNDKSIINVQKSFENPKKIMVMWSEKLKNIEYLFSVKETLEKKYPQSELFLMFISHPKLYKEVMPDNSFFSKIPKPRYFYELDDVLKIRNIVKQIDIFFDLTSIDERLRLMFLNTLKPTVSVSAYSPLIKEDYNILFKLEKGTPLTIFELLGFETIKKSFISELSEINKNMKIEKYEYVLIGKSRSVRNAMNRCIKDGSKFFYIDDFNEKIDLFAVSAMRNCKNIIYDPILTEDIEFISSTKPGVR